MEDGCQRNRVFGASNLLKLVSNNLRYDILNTAILKKIIGIFKIVI